ncbi:hypothetical protein HBH56_017830 [Parastagonospora nodorum]|uniref:Tafazzin n=2 Tax=Phaeosphaeria nodorum (strain SN15 / ATCC MYA-4574 / FGSC 10173) TaxID=321614 RepID=A0A7U2I0V0_PHANO|nr:hypothetical protein HBH56_017830 [Parastagonospora nodorum]QRC95217.1 hypothetical protein JI435_029210 [Parastagonospora nodorum SN15]KAH4137029.1 hypothetical protein HBH45_124140 [Parastagonospora nodorum]KAH4242228.1 hypothetical protein HBI06_018330 [Parastagonospora nodorum]KAH4569121.1 hypothetical protein HBH84_125580 [Parastagonospora nodorum]
MPKKHAPAYTTTKPNYVHPSLQSSRASPSTPSEPQSVNQRIAQLRREQAPRATIEQRNEMHSGVSSRTVPPDLRRILAIPEVNAPKPKAGTRLRMRGPGGARPPPGPAAPTSWLKTSRYAPKQTRDYGWKKPGERAASRLSHLARVTETDFKRMPPPRSLRHHCLRTFAEHWVELSEYEQYYIPTLPMVLREALLSYLTLYGEEGCLDFKSFKILFQPEEDGALEWEDVRFLDLTGVLGADFSLNDLGKCLKRVLSQVPEDLKALSLSDTTSKGKAKAPVDVADSWEEEIDDDDDAQPVLPAQLTVPHFTNLSRLSLAHAGECASWPDLLKISPNLNKITHLSLAYWPRPTLTPNSSTTSMVSDYARVSLGGTPFYSDLDDDWHEASNILRRFSVNTYSLEWLDLEGCQWIRALTWHPFTPDTTQHAVDTWSIAAASPGPDWNDAWRRIVYLNFFQGWIPADRKSLQNMPAGVIPVQLMRWLRENKDEDMSWKLNAKERGYAVQEWIEKEKTSRSVASEILAMRRRKEGSWCKIDPGWGEEV